MKSPFVRIHLLGYGELFVVRPDFLARSPKQLEYFVQLVLVALAAEQGGHVDELSKDAADGPHVDVRRVQLLAEQELRGAVPERDDHRRVVLEGGPVLSGQAKVADLYDAAVAQKDVGCFEIPENEKSQIT